MATRLGDLSAHGRAKIRSRKRRMRRRLCSAIDATCPLVTKGIARLATLANAGRHSCSSAIRSIRRVVGTMGHVAAKVRITLVGDARRHVGARDPDNSRLFVDADDPLSVGPRYPRISLLALQARFSKMIAASHIEEHLYATTNSPGSAW